jgi:hypothetical protein
LTLVAGEGKRKERSEIRRRGKEDRGKRDRDIEE